MEALLHFAGNFWWLIFPLGGVIGGGVRAVAAANERRAQRRLERYRIKQQTKVALAEASATDPAGARMPDELTTDMQELSDSRSYVATTRRRRHAKPVVRYRENR